MVPLVGFKSDMVYYERSERFAGDVTSIANRIKRSGNAIPTPDFDYNKVTDYSIDVEKLYALEERMAKSFYKKASP